MLSDKIFYKGLFLYFFSVFFGTTLFKDSVSVYGSIFVSALIVFACLVRPASVRLTRGSVIWFICAFFPILLASVFGVSPADSVVRVLLYALPVFSIIILCQNVDPYVGVKRLSLWFGGMYGVLVLLSCTALLLGEISLIGDRLYNNYNFIVINYSQVVMGGEIKRLGGATGNPNQFGYWGAFAFMLLITGRRVGKSKVDGVLIVLSIAGVALSQSRLSGGMVLAYLACYVFINYKEMKRGALLILIGLSGAVVYVIAFIFKMRNSFGGSGAALLNERDQIWGEMFSRFLESPLWGTGFASSELVLAGALHKSPHNFYLYLLLEVGVLGATGVLLLMVCSLFYSMRAIFIARRDVFLSLMLSILVVVYISLFFEVMVFSSNVVTSLMAALVVFLWRFKLRSKSSPPV